MGLTATHNKGTWPNGDAVNHNHYTFVIRENIQIYVLLHIARLPEGASEKGDTREVRSRSNRQRYPVNGVRPCSRQGTRHRLRDAVLVDSAAADVVASCR